MLTDTGHALNHYTNTYPSHTPTNKKQKSKEMIPGLSKICMASHSCTDPLKTKHAIFLKIKFILQAKEERDHLICFIAVQKPVSVATSGY